MKNKHIVRPFVVSLSPPKRRTDPPILVAENHERFTLRQAQGERGVVSR